MGRGERSGRSGGGVDPQLLKLALAPHPKLRAALFPAGSRGNGQTSDISVYHLLQVPERCSQTHKGALWVCLLSWCVFQSLHPLDPSRLFGWQVANTLNSTGETQISDPDQTQISDPLIHSIQYQ